MVNRRLEEFFSIVFGICLIVCNSAAFAQCPIQPIGIHVEQSGSNKRFYATDMAEALAANEDSRRLAAAEARVAARALLKNHPSVPKSSLGRLRGITNIGDCAVENMVYATVLLDELTSRRIIVMEDAVETSIRSAPTPTQGSRP
jgi:hypothetical protein